MIKKNKVLVFSAHPDDEVLGCGGTIAYHAKKGDEVFVCYLSEGVSARFDINNKAKLEKEKALREAMAFKAAKILNFKIVEFIGMPNLRMEDQSKLDITKQIIAINKKVNPSIVYMNFPGDLNTDHKVTFDSVYTALRPSPDNGVKIIRCYEVLSSTEWASNIDFLTFKPDTFVDVSEFIEKKFKSISAYEGEMRDFPHPRSKEVIESLMKFRGSQVGLRYAEAFITIRNIIN